MEKMYKTKGCFQQFGILHRPFHHPTQKIDIENYYKKEESVKIPVGKFGRGKG